jgi:hypothetical protein
LKKTECVEAGLALSKLVSKLEAGSRIADKIHEPGFAIGILINRDSYELQVFRASIDTSIDNLKRKRF